MTAGTGSATHDRTGEKGRPRIVVGVDGSPGARAALAQALLTAARRAADLQVVVSYGLELFWVGGAPLDVPDVTAVREDTQSRARSLLQEVQDELAGSGAPGVRDVDVELVVSEGPASHVLLQQAEGAELLVVGSRGRGGVRSALLGSVALHCVTHAACPVLVVHQHADQPTDRDTTAAATPPSVVVGVDGSADSRAALGEAYREAAFRGVGLDVVVTYRMADYWTAQASVFIPSEEQVHADLRRSAEDLVRVVIEERPLDPGTPEPHVRIVVAQGSAVDVLVHHGRTAELLVVGGRGHGEFRGLLVGSTALYTAMHAACPVLVVHRHGPRGAAQEARREEAVTGR